MKKIPLTQGLFAIVDDEDCEYLSQWRWYAQLAGRSIYAMRRRRKADGPGPTIIRMHRVILNPSDGTETDHINGDGLDDRRENLRAVTRGINGANQNHRWRNRKHNLPMGVYPSGRGFKAQIQIDGHLNYLGAYDTPAEASYAYMAARTERIAAETGQ